MLFYGRSDIGKVRHLNEDSFTACSAYAVVADGMGGHNAGEVASGMTVEIIGRALEKEGVDVKAVREAVENANKQVYEAASADSGCSGMGSTAVLMVVSCGTAILANVGDSRGYHYQKSTGRLHQVTKDHSLVQELLSAGKLTAQEAAKYPYRNVITRAIGTAPGVSVDIFDVEIQPGDLFLLCTDGLTNCVSPALLKRAISTRRGLEEMCDKLVAAALKAGGRDNVTIVALEVTGGDVNE